MKLLVAMIVFWGVIGCNNASSCPSNFASGSCSTTDQRCDYQEVSCSCGSDKIWACSGGPADMAVAQCGSELQGSVLMCPQVPFDMAPTSDGGFASSTANVKCGNTTCSPPSNVCCSSDPTSTGTCAMASDTCSNLKFFCDDPSDCPAGQDCCIVPNGGGTGSLCMSASDCTSQGGLQGCQMPSDCNGQGTCCNNAPASHCCQK